MEELEGPAVCKSQLIDQFLEKDSVLERRFEILTKRNLYSKPRAWISFLKIRLFSHRHRNRNRHRNRSHLIQKIYSETLICQLSHQKTSWTVQELQEKTPKFGVLVAKYPVPPPSAHMNKCFRCISHLEL